MAAAFKSVQPAEYYRKFLEQEIRPDGRDLWKIRPTAVNVGSISTAEGSSVVKLGNTTIVCGIKAELSVPKPEEPNKGYLVPNVELPPLASSRFKPGPPSEQAQVTSQLVTDIITNSNCVALEELCIQEEKVAWVLYCDMVCLDYDGNVVDAAVIALLSALKNVSLPKISIDNETGKFEVSRQEKLPIKIHSQPVSTTFALFDDTIVLADPTSEEECLASGIIIVALVDSDHICTLHKPGGSSIPEIKLQECIEHAKQRAKEVRRLIHEATTAIDR